jgi:hypothetical protein
MRKRKKKLEKGKEARRRARVAAAAPAVTRVLADMRKKREKHKGKWLKESDSSVVTRDW